MLRVAKSKMRRGNGVIKLAHAANRSETILCVAQGKKSRFILIAAQHAFHEAPLVHVIIPALERIGARGKIHRGAHRSDSAQLRWKRFGKFDGNFRYQIAAYGVTHE